MSLSCWLHLYTQCLSAHTCVALSLHLRQFVTVYRVPSFSWVPQACWFYNSSFRTGLSWSSGLRQDESPAYNDTLPPSLCLWAPHPETLLQTTLSLSDLPLPWMTTQVSILVQTLYSLCPTESLWFCMLGLLPQKGTRLKQCQRLEEFWIGYGVYQWIADLTL